MWGQYELLRPGQIDAIRERTPVAYLPWGALEWHSYHNPVGLDGLKAHGICKALAQETGGIVLPPVYAGINTMKPYKGFKHTLEHREATITALCAEYLEQLADEGFRVIILLMGHYGAQHVAVLKEAAAAFEAAHPAVRVWAFPDHEPVGDQFSGNHAAKGETSYQMLFNPETVDLSALPQDRRTTLDDDGVSGDDPRESSADYGQAQLDALKAATVDRIRALLA
jgi:creatinine amidohydrolase